MQFVSVALVFACIAGLCNAGCEVVRSGDEDVGLLVKETYDVDNQIWLKPEASFKAVNISLFSRNIPIMRETFVPSKWNIIRTKVLYSNTLNKCAIGVTVNDKKQYVIVARCASGLGFIHQDAVMRVKVSGGSRIAISCDPEAYEFATTVMAPVTETPHQSETATIIVFAGFMICIALALIYLKVTLFIHITLPHTHYY